MSLTPRYNPRVHPSARGATLDSRSSFVTVVSGYPRSGTSLMMQMLEAGGLDVLVGGVKEADVHNPRGYYEYGPALALGGPAAGADWARDALGKAVKVMAFHLQHLPDDLDYRVVFMRRTIA